MGFLHSYMEGVGGSNASIKSYTIPIDNTSFSESDSQFKVNIVHNLDTNNLIAQVNNNGLIEVVTHKYISNNEIEVYYKSASDVVVTITGFNKISYEDSSVIGMGIVGKMVLGKN